jgi:DNA topoisomerase IB
MRSNGHIQATGLDDAGRKQYLYHQHWREARDREKFQRMEDFAKVLPRLRGQVLADLGRHGLVRARVLACAVRLLDLGLFRIGGEEYAAGNESYGLATLQRKHLSFDGAAALFDYPAKSGQRRSQTLEDAVSLSTLKALRSRPPGAGKELLAYREGRRWSDVRSAEINEYVKEHAGADYSAKDFRTWNATVLAAVALAQEKPPESKTARKRASSLATKRVSAYLGNTPAVCRSAYIDPRVFDRFDSGTTIRASIARLNGSAEPGEFPDREKIERAVLKLLK